MKRLKLRKEVKKLIIKLILTMCIANVCLVIYRVLGQVGYLATESNTYAAGIILGWLIFFSLIALVINVIWGE